MKFSDLILLVLLPFAVVCGMWKFSLAFQKQALNNRADTWLTVSSGMIWVMTGFTTFGVVLWFIFLTVASISMKR